MTKTKPHPPEDDDPNALEQCPRCRRPLEPEDDKAWSAAWGGWVCLPCYLELEEP